MSNVTQQELLLKAQAQFDAMLRTIKQHTRDQTRTDLVERDLFDQFLDIGHTTLSAFVAGAGDGNEGDSVEIDGNRLQRSDHPHRRIYHSIFGEIEIDRFVYAPGVKKKIAYSPVDTRLGLPRGEYSYVLEDWLEQLCVKEPFAEGVSGLASILGLRPSVRTAEVLNQRMAEPGVFSCPTRRSPSADGSGNSGSHRRWYECPHALRPSHVESKQDGRP